MLVVDTNQRRRPAGTPTGGQFSQQPHSESNVALADEPASSQTPTPQQVAHLYHQIEASTRYYNRRWNVDVEELSARLLDSMSRLPPQKYTSSAYVHGSAHRIAASILGRDQGGNEFNALRDYREQRAAWEQANGHVMSPVMCDQLAEQVRAAQPNRRRARRGFHTEMTTVSLEGKATEFTSIAESVDWSTPETFLLDKERDRIFGRFDEQETENLARSEGAWAALATIYGAPKSNPTSIDEVTATKIRKQVKQLGGAGYAASAYLNGAISEDGAEALFVPFGGEHLDVRGREMVAETLARLPSGQPGSSPADLAFTDAVRVATRNKARSARDWRGYKAAKKAQSGK